MDVLSIIVIFFFFIIFVIIVIYLVSTYLLPKKLDEIANMIEMGQIKLAIKKLDDIIEKDDRNSYAHYLLAEAHLKDGNKQYAIVEYRQVLKLAKFDQRMKEIDVRRTLAHLYIERNSSEEAKKELLILTKLDPYNYENYFELGKIFFNAGKIEKSTSFFKKSIEYNPDNDLSYYYLGQAYYRNSLFADAKQMFLTSIKKEPRNYKAHYFLGLTLRQVNDFEWAIKEFEIAQKYDELKVKCFLAKGSCYLERGQFPKAMMEFERGLKFVRRGSDTELNLRYYLAECQEKTRDIQSAIFNWEKIISVNDSFKDVPDKLKSYSEFRQDDRIKDFLIAGLSQFEHLSRKIVEAMGHKISDVDIISDTEIEIIASDSTGKWRNTRQTNKVVRIIRTTDTIQEKLLRKLNEQMKTKNATRVLVVTTGDFSQQAIEYANTRPVELIGKSDLIEILRKK